MYGDRQTGAIRVFPDSSLQSLVGAWWERTEDKKIRRGRLLWAFVWQSEIIPLELIPEGRGDDSGDHSRAKYKIAQLRINQSSTTSRLPVAGLTHFPDETHLACRAKKRPVLVVSPGGPDVPKPLRVGGANKQYAPYLSVAPYYGAIANGKRAGYNPTFVERVKACEYPQFMWDKLPIPTLTEESLLRLDHVQPIGRHADSYKVTEYCLGGDALKILDEWQMWLQTGLLPEDGVLHMFREGLGQIG